jgi:hypothetical protein
MALAAGRRDRTLVKFSWVSQDQVGKMWPFLLEPKLLLLTSGLSPLRLASGGRTGIWEI